MVLEVIGALITKSANDATTVMVQKLAGTETRFAHHYLQSAPTRHYTHDLNKRVGSA